MSSSDPLTYGGGLVASNAPVWYQPVMFDQDNATLELRVTVDRESPFVIVGATIMNDDGGWIECQAGSERSLNPTLRQDLTETFAMWLDRLFEHVPPF